MKYSFWIFVHHSSKVCFSSFDWMMDKYFACKIFDKKCVFGYNGDMIKVWIFYENFCLIDIMPLGILRCIKYVYILLCIMKNAITHLKGHIKDYHRHYLFGIFGGFALFKLFLLLMGITVIQYTYTHTQTFAELETGCTMTGQYFTGEYETWCIDIPEELTGGYLIDCETLTGYRTGWTLNESGDLVDQIWIDEEIETWCVLTGQTIIPAYTTWCYLTWWYRTGWTEICDEEVWTGEEETLTGEENIILWNGICESDDIVWNAPLSWSVFRDVFSFDWAYSGADCLILWLHLQLLDHNDQWIDVATLASWATTVSFDSKQLYSFQQSGLYHIIWTNMSWDDYYLYTGTYTWEYSRLFTWYVARIVDAASGVIYETWPFTIDNELPTLTGVTVTANGSTTWYLWESGVVILSFTASELLDDVVVTLWSGKVPTTSSISNLTHTYTWTLNSLYREGDISVAVAFADVAGNTWALVYTSALIFDMTDPVVSWIVFTGSDSWLVLNFASSEPVHFGIDYRKDSTILHWADSEYLTSHQILIPNIEVDHLYTFALEVFDHAHNSRVVTGDVMKTSSGDITSHITVVALVTQEELSGEVATLTNILKTEVEKYSTCKDAINYTPVELEIRRSVYTLQMPDFQKSQVKVLVNAFTLFVLDKIKHNYTITKSDIDEITKKFNSFLIVLKLLRDDDNTCKQNLSNYHVGQFKNVLEEFKIELD